jgi:hypothetical protein
VSGPSPEPAPDRFYPLANAPRLAIPLPLGEDRWVQGLADAREVIIRHAAPIELARTVRSTLIQSSLATLRTEGHYER